MRERHRDLGFRSECNVRLTVAAMAVRTPNDIGQGIRLKSTPIGRWLKVRILTNHGDKEATTLGDVSVSGRPQAG